MSYKNFVPTVWAEGINRELEKALVFAPNTNQKYEGSVTQRGDTVKILGVGKVTVTTQKGSGPIILTDPEEIEDTSVSMIIDTVSDFNYRIDDIDKRNAVDGLVDALNKEVCKDFTKNEWYAFMQALQKISNNENIIIWGGNINGVDAE